VEKIFINIESGKLIEKGRPMSRYLVVLETIYSTKIVVENDVILRTDKAGLGVKNKRNG
jgi:hypothetical protein